MSQKKEAVMQKMAVVIILATICDLLWGSAFPFIKLGYMVFDIPSDETATQILFAGIRFTLAGLLVILLYLAFISAMAYSLWATLLAYNPISRVAVMGFLNPVFGVILSAIILKEGDIVNYKSIIALVLVCLGICVVYWNGKKTAAKKDSIE